MTNLASIVKESINDVKVTSLQIVELINKEREMNGNTIVLQHSDFRKKVVQVLGETGLGNFSDSYINAQNKSQPCFSFPVREASLMAMSYSYSLQAAVYDRMMELENEKKNAVPTFVLPDFTNPVEAARAWANEVEQKQEYQEIAHLQEEVIGQLDQKIEQDQPKVIFFDQVAESDVTHNISNVAAKVGMTAQQLNKILDGLDVYDKRVKIPRQFKNWFIKDGLGLMITTQTGHSQARLTTRGEQWTIRQLHDLQLIKKKEHKNAHHHLMFDEAAYNPYAI